MKYKYSDKQKEIILQAIHKELKFINILEGSVRSGKTFIANLAWCIFVLNSPHENFLMSGESTDSIYRNVIGDIIQIIGRGHAVYQNSAKGGAQLIIHYNKKRKICYCRGASKANDEGKIRGITIGGWYGDEITLHHESFVKQALSRMSLEGAKAIWTTNPDSPFHYIYNEYIEKAERKGYNHWHFTLEDNISLSEEYKNNIKNAYAGIFYERFILGIWKLTDGIIYDMFDKKEHIVPTENRNYILYYVSCDFGMQNPTTFGLFGRDSSGKWYKVKEYRYSGREKKVQKTVSELTDDLEDFIGFNKNIWIIIDPSAAAFITEVKKRGYKVKKAKNEVLRGIQNVASALKKKEILFNDCNIETFKEFETYIWDEKASLQGEDVPKKENDHHMDDLRYFINTILYKKTEGHKIRRF